MTINDNDSEKTNILTSISKSNEMTMSNQNWISRRL